MAAIGAAWPVQRKAPLWRHMSDNQTVLRALDALCALPDPQLAAYGVCSLIAQELSDACVALTSATPGTGTSMTVLADYPAGMRLPDPALERPVSALVAASGKFEISLHAWRATGDRPLTAAAEELLEQIAPRLAELVERLGQRTDPALSPRIDAETGTWTLSAFLDQVERRIDRLDIEDKRGAMLVFGWVRADGLDRPDATSAVVRASTERLRDLLRPSDILGRVAATRLAAWCDGVDHLIAAERATRIAESLEIPLLGSGRHFAIGIASRLPRTGHGPEGLLHVAQAGFEQARLAAAADRRPAVRIAGLDADVG